MDRCSTVGYYGSMQSCEADAVLADQSEGKCDQLMQSSSRVQQQLRPITSDTQVTEMSFAAQAVLAEDSRLSLLAAERSSRLSLSRAKQT